ncbi:MAG TPA: polysaccharide deacetylase family protein [Anaeromyxobacteraceae bacterium]|nr:polysaccharide deacetylase family protein [Anaeromyxobacteraceae bacterium]
MRVHISVHDVSPASATEVEEALVLCRERDLVPALLVVPNFHGRTPMRGRPEFCSRLRELQREGHEIFLHGYLHQGSRNPGRREQIFERLRRLYAQSILSDDEAEFSDLSRVDAEGRLDAGEAVLRQVGLCIDGFVPPAWTMPRWLVPLLARRGYRFCEDHLRIYDPAGGRAQASLVLNFSSRSPAKICSSIAWCRMARHAGAILGARLAIHPGDLRSRVLCRELVDLLDWAQGRAVRTAKELFT